MTQTKTKPQAQAAPLAQEPDIDLDMFGEGADLLEQQLTQAGFRRIQHFNENHTYHRETSVENGGYGIRNEDGSAPQIGPTELIKHRNKKQTMMNVATQIDMALVGFSDTYWTIEYDDPAGSDKRVNLIVPDYTAPDQMPGANGRCRKGISFFVVLKVDDDRKLYELSFKGFTVEEATKCIMDLKFAANQFKQAKGITGAVHPFAFWVTLGLAESKMVGSEEQSAVTPPKWMIENTPLSARLVSKADYLKFIDLRRELDAFLATGRYKGGTQLQQLAAPAGANAPALAAPQVSY